MYHIQVLEGISTFNPKTYAEEARVRRARLMGRRVVEIKPLVIDYSESTWKKPTLVEFNAANPILPFLSSCAWKRIARAVNLVFGNGKFSMEEIFPGRSRCAGIVRIRQMTEYLMCIDLRLHKKKASLPLIAYLLDCDHTTILHSYRKMEALIARDEEVRNKMNIARTLYLSVWT